MFLALLLIITKLRIINFFLLGTIKNIIIRLTPMKRNAAVCLAANDKC